MSGRRKELLAVLGLMLLAFVLRVLYVLDMQDSPLFYQPSLDSAYHVDWAKAFAAGEDFHPGPFFRAPLYLWFLGLIFKFAGPGLLLPRLIQCGLGALTTGLVYLVGKRAFDRRVGFLASLAAATYWVLIYFDGELLIPSLLVPLLLLGLWLALGLSPAPRPRSAALAGFVFGVAAITRPNVLLFMPFLAIWIAWLAVDAVDAIDAGGAGGAGRKWRAALRPAGAFSLALLAPILPVTAYNTFVAGDFALIATQAGVNFWIGNNPASDGHTAVVPGTRAGWWDGYDDAISQAEAAEGRSLKAGEVSRHYSGRAWNFIFEQPGAASAQFVHKAKLFWSDEELGNNQPVRFYSHHFSPWVRFLPLGYSFLIAFGTLGLLLTLGRTRRLFPLSGFVLVYTFSVLMFFVCARFRVPVLPALMVFGAYAALWLIEAWRAGRIGSAAGGSAFLAVAILASTSGPGGVRTSESTGYWNLGVAEALRGNDELATRHLERAVQLDAANTYAKMALAKHLDGLGENERAITLLQQVLMQDGSQINAVDQLMQIFLRTQRYTELEDVAQQAMRLAPQLPMPYQYLGEARMAQDRPDDALALYQQAAQRDPKGFAPFLALGRASIALKRGPAAVQALKQALTNRARADRQGLSQAYELLVQLLVGSNHSQALEHARQYVELFPKNQRARALLDEVERRASSGG